MVCWLCSHTKINLTFTYCISQEFQICAVMLSNTELWTRLHIYWLVAPLHVCRFTEMLKQNFAFRLEIKTFKCLLVSDVTTSGHESLFALFMSELIHGRDVWLDNVWCCPPSTECFVWMRPGVSETMKASVHRWRSTPHMCINKT